MSDKELERLERAAFRRFYEDGLFDVYLGLLLAGFPATAWLDRVLDNGLLVAVLFYGTLVTAFLLLRRYVVRPRTGSFRPGTERRRKVLAVRIALGVSVALGLGLFALGSVLGGPPQGLLAWVPLILLVNCVVVFGLMAYYLDVPRFFVYGWVFGLALLVREWVERATGTRPDLWLVFGVPGLAIVGVGVYKLVRFLRAYPVRASEIEPHAAV